MDGPPKGDGADFDYINVNKPVHAVREFRESGFSDVFCGNGNFCGRNTSGPGICSKSNIFDTLFCCDSHSDVTLTPTDGKWQ